MLFNIIMCRLLIPMMLVSNKLVRFFDANRALLMLQKKNMHICFYFNCMVLRQYLILAKFIANLIVDLNKNHRVSLDNILLVGHSLGGQITGFVGKHVYKHTGQKLPRIIALDPAGPLFVQRPDDKRLNKDDAEVVEVIHSDGGTFGFKDATGTIDFFPNGGSSQPGCTRIDLVDITSFIDPSECFNNIYTRKYLFVRTLF